MENYIEKLKEMVGKCRVGMLGVYGDDRMHFGPMSHVDIDDQGNLWFFISNESGMAFTIKDDPSVHLTYAHEPDGTFLSIEGIARINGSKAKMKELFNSYVKAWFPKGLDDPTLSLLVVRPTGVDYWTNESKILTHNKMFSANVSKKNISQSHEGRLRV